jgi:hypothetical protein
METIINKVSDKVMKGFELCYFNKENPMFTGQRFGQAFLNYCLPEVKDNALFYEENTDVARVIIWLNYVE